jgi:hypothetical protein
MGSLITPADYLNTCFMAIFPTGSPASHGTRPSTGSTPFIHLDRTWIFSIRDERAMHDAPPCSYLVTQLITFQVRCRSRIFRRPCTQRIPKDSILSTSARNVIKPCVSYGDRIELGLPAAARSLIPTPQNVAN